MKKSPIKYVGCLVLAVIITMLTYFVVIKLTAIYQKPLQSCRSLLDLRHGEFSLQVVFNFTFIEGQGTVTVNGTGQANGSKFAIDREISFNYSTGQDRYLMKGTALRRFSNDSGKQNGVGLHLPDFFTRSNGQLPLSVAYDEYNTPVLLLAGTPLFYCQSEEVVW